MNKNNMIVTVFLIALLLLNAWILGYKIHSSQPDSEPAEAQREYVGPVIWIHNETDQNLMVKTRSRCSWSIAPQDSVEVPSICFSPKLVIKTE